MILNLFGLVKTQVSDYNLLIKTHPGYNQNFVSQKLIDNNLIDFKTNKNIQDCLASSNLVITSASSSALESVFSETPTLLVSNCSGLLKNPIPFDISRELWSICYDENDIVSKINYFMNLSKKELINLKKTSNFNIHNYVEPKVICSTNNFLGIN